MLAVRLLCLLIERVGGADITRRYLTFFLPTSNLAVRTFQEKMRQRERPLGDGDLVSTSVRRGVSVYHP